MADKLWPPVPEGHWRDCCRRRRDTHPRSLHRTRRRPKAGNRRARGGHQLHLWVRRRFRKGENSASLVGGPVAVVAEVVAGFGCGLGHGAIRIRRARGRGSVFAALHQPPRPRSRCRTPPSRLSSPTRLPTRLSSTMTPFPTPPARRRERRQPFRRAGRPPAGTRPPLRRSTHRWQRPPGPFRPPEPGEPRTRPSSCPHRALAVPLARHLDRPPAPVDNRQGRGACDGGCYRLRAVPHRPGRGSRDGSSCRLGARLRT